nr:MAG TPA: hypothetical protein [Caudoviricetes sp.]
MPQILHCLMYCCLRDSNHLKNISLSPRSRQE